MSFRDASVQLTASLSKEEKQRQGIFFTPKEDRDTLFAILDRFNVSPNTILEPSFGSGEFLEDLYERYPNAKITGVELNPTLFQAQKRPNVIHQDFLEYKRKHRLIVGNPPYVLIESSEETLKCQTGRPNLFVQFLYKAIEVNLAQDGYLAFVLPTSLFNCLYYEPMRRYLFEKTTILAVEPLTGKYLDTAQKTFALVLRKGKRNDDFFVMRNGNCYLTPYHRELQGLLTGSRTLAEIGYSVKTGGVVWNQVKEKLSDTGTLLIYSGNFNTGKIVLNNLKQNKKQYVQGISKPPLSGKSILINRGYGNTEYRLTAVLVDYPEYHVENHVNIIRPTTPEAAEHIQKVYRSLCDERTAKFIEYFVGNGALSKTEIENCVPIWLD
jgi:tRNA1(Val) A37 N6-methylase TrmN6